MSLFPKRICPGREVFIHVRRRRSVKPMPEVTRLFLIAPNGARQLIDQREVFPATRSSLKASPKKKNNNFFEVTPPAIFAEYLGQGRTEVKWFRNFFKEIVGASNNWYCRYKMEMKAIPGRYEIILETICNGRLESSKSRKFDHFFVDSIKVFKMLKIGSMYQLTIKNLSPEVTPLCIWELINKANGNVRITNKIIQLLPNEEKRILTTTKKIFLSYRFETEFMRINYDNDPYIQRNMKYLFLDNKTKKELYLIRPEDLAGQRAIVLKNRARIIWLKCSGLMTRSEVIKKSDYRFYKSMLAKGFLVEKPLAN